MTDLHQIDLLRRYAKAVAEAPRYLGLTSSADRAQVHERHVEDAQMLATVIPEELRTRDISVIDVGSGNGVPGAVWAILFPGWKVTLLDSDSKKCGFLESFCNINAIENVNVKLVRAENFAHSDVRQTFDLSVSRAVGSFSTSLELTAAFTKIGGYTIVSRGTSSNADLESSAKVMQLLGFSSPQQVLYKVRRNSYEAIVLNKVFSTPNAYPRAVGKPAKRPL